MIEYVAWRELQILMRTPQGLYLWTSSFQACAGCDKALRDKQNVYRRCEEHKFRPLREDELANWGLT